MVTFLKTAARSRSASYPHAAGLHCGACGGQTGEVNARALADLLNTPAVRTHLRILAVDVPERTHYREFLKGSNVEQNQPASRVRPTG